MNKPPLKPGWKSSEFWVTVVTFIFSGLYIVGLISDNDQKEDVIRDVSHGVESVILISGQLAILWKYINSRKEIKKTWWGIPDHSDTPEVKPVETKNGEKKNDKRKTKKQTTRTNKKQPTKSK